MDGIGSRIKLLRGRLNLSQDKLAARMRVHHTYISSIEREKQMPSDMFIAFMALQFGVSEAWLRTGEGPMMASPAPAARGPEMAAEGRAKYIAIDRGDGSEETDEDRKLAYIINDIRLFWRSTTPEMHSWFKVQFYKTFPEVEELKKSVEEQSASSIA